jgi:hypothetical protein
MNSARRELLFSISAIVLTTLVTYGALIPQLGFYRDDWYLVWTAQAQGSQGLLNLFSVDRPFDGWLYVFDFWLLGVSPLGWHLYALFIKLTSALAFFWLLRSLWEARKLETTFIALLFIVYPGFLQQPNALTFKQLVLSYAAAMLSLALTINAVKAQKVSVKILFTLLAVLLSAVYALIYEALIGIEVARALLLLYLFYQSKDWKQALKSAFWNALPYFIFMSSFLYWRLFVFVAKRKSTDVGNIAGNYSSAHGFIGFAVEYAKDLIETSFLAWGVPLYQFWNQVVYKELGQAVAVALAVLIFAAGYYFLVKNQTALDADDSSARDWIMLGALIVAVTTLPVVAAGRNVIFGVQWDRYTYQSVFGVALFMGGIIFYAIKGNLRWALLALLLTSGVMTQFFSANYYRNYWKAEREVFWQLAWRAPQIKEGTTLILSTPGAYSPAEEYEVWGPVNMIYHPKDSSLKLAAQIMSDKLWVDLARGTQEERLVRDTITVKRNYENAIVLSQPTSNSCLHVLDGARFDQVVTESADVRQIAQYSRADLINAAAKPIIPPGEVFGAEPPHEWCYYYQKMDLARQSSDWKTVAAFAAEADALELSPADLSEWLPALEAYVHLNDAKKIKRIVILIRVDRTVYESLCANYKILRNAPADYDRAALFDALCTR